MNRAQSRVRCVPWESPHGALKDFAALAKVMARGADSLAIRAHAAHRKTPEIALIGGDA